MRKPDKQVLIQDKHKCYMKRGMKGKLIPCLRFKSRSHSMQNKADTAYPSLAILFLVLLTSEWLKAQYFGHTSKCPKARLQILALDLFFPCFFFLFSFFFPPPVLSSLLKHIYFLHKLLVLSSWHICDRKLFYQKNSYQLQYQSFGG